MLLKQGLHFSPDDNNGGGGAGSNADDAGGGKDKSGGDGSGGKVDDFAELRTALKAELDSARELTKELRGQKKGGKAEAPPKKSKEQENQLSEDEAEAQAEIAARIQSLEEENRKFRVNRAIADSLKKQSAKLEKDGLTLDIEGAMELLELANPAEDQVDTAVKKVVERLKKPATAKPGNDNKQARTDGGDAGGLGGNGQIDIANFDHGTASLSDWAKLFEADQNAYNRHMAAAKAKMKTGQTLPGFQGV